MEKFGGSLTFRMFGIGALTLFLLHVIVQKVLEKYGRRSGKEFEEKYNQVNITMPISD